MGAHVNILARTSILIYRRANIIMEARVYIIYGRAPIFIIIIIIIIMRVMVKTIRKIIIIIIIIIIVIIIIIIIIIIRTTRIIMIRIIIIIIIIIIITKKVKQWLYIRNTSDRLKKTKLKPSYVQRILKSSKCKHWLQNTFI